MKKIIIISALWFLLYNILFIDLSVSVVVRRTPAFYFSPGEISVIIQITGETGNLTIVETPPPNLFVIRSTITNNGVLSSNIVTWNLKSIAGDIYLHYDLKVTLSAEGDLAFHGTSNGVEIGGDVIIPPANFSITKPINMGTPINSSSPESSPMLSADGLEMIFMSERPGGLGGWDFWVTRRASLTSPWEKPVNLDSPVNTSGHEFFPCLSVDGLTLFFATGFFKYSTSRPGGMGMSDIWMATRESVDTNWNTPINLGAPVNSTGLESAPNLSADGLTLLFYSDRRGGMGGYDLWMAVRESTQAPFDTVMNMGPVVNSFYNEIEPSLSRDGLRLFFQALERNNTDSMVWMTTRASVHDEWRAPIKLPASINSGTIAAAGPYFYGEDTLYFLSLRSGGMGAEDLWYVKFIPQITGIPYWQDYDIPRQEGW